MKKNLTRFLTKMPCGFFNKRTIIFFLSISIVSVFTHAQVTNTFTYTGAMQSFTVPACVNALSVSIAGAKGGDGSYPLTGPGGWGGHMAAVISVTPGQVLNLYVGGTGGNASSGNAGIGGYNGGGTGASNSTFYSGGGGGGASDIRISPYTLSDRLIVVGGGGGGGTYTNSVAGFERGGSGGTATGGNGYSNNSNTNGNGGGGGGNSAGGSGGFMAAFCTAQSGSLGIGGAANTCSNGGGGGGGGYYGGGGGISAGGGGGSSYAVLSSSTVVQSLGANPGNGSITIAYSPSFPTINIASTSTITCAGSALSFTASGGVNYTWTTLPASQTVTGQSIFNHTFTTQGAVAVNVVGSNNLGCTSSTVMIVIVNTSPLMVAGATKTVICSGGSTTLNAAGASIYQWDSNANNATAASTIVNPTTTTLYHVNGTLSATGCTATASVMVHIYIPTVSISGNTAVCSGNSNTLTMSVINPASGATNSYTWTGPGLPSNMGSTLMVSPTALTVYTASAKSVTNGNVSCVGSTTVAVLVNGNPTVTVKPYPQVVFFCRGYYYNLVAEGAENYSWNDGNFTATGDTLTFTTNQIGTIAFTVVGTDANGCVGDTVFYVKVNSCGGIEEFDQNNASISIYPNPGDGEFNIISDKNMKLNLTNELGQIVREFEISAYNEYKLQVADLAKGIYFISGSNSQAVMRQKIIVK